MPLTLRKGFYVEDPGSTQAGGQALDFNFTKLGNIGIPVESLATGSGTDGDPWVGWHTSITDGDTPYIFGKGVYGLASPLTLSVDRLKIFGAPGSRIKYTGGSTASAVITLTCSSGDTTTTIKRVSIGGELTIDGGGNAGIGLELRGCHGSRFRLFVVAVTNTQILAKWGVNNRYSLQYHPDFDGAPYPAYGIVLDELDPDVPSYCTASILDNCWFVGCSSIGLWMKKAIGCVGIGGAFELNTANAQLDGSNNVLIAVDLEGSGPTTINGSGNGLEYVYSGGNLVLNGTNNTIKACFFAEIAWNAEGNSYERDLNPYTTHTGTFKPTVATTAVAGGYFADSRDGDDVRRVPAGKRFGIGTASQASGSPSAWAGEFGIFCSVPIITARVQLADDNIRGSAFRHTYTGGGAGQGDIMWLGACGDFGGSGYNYNPALVDALGITAAKGILMPHLPTADPHIAGQLWNSSGVLTVSAG